jgi:hypothetical protein
MMLKGRKVAVALLVLLGLFTFLLAQTPGAPQAYIWFRDTTGHHLVPLNGSITIAADRKSATITTGQPYTFGTGFIVTGTPPNPVQISLDTAYVLYRAVPPTGPGSCDIATGARAVDANYGYDCIPDGTGHGFKWARAPIETDW